MAERKDYSGDFDPEFRFEDLSKEALVRLVREYALIAQLLDRSVFAAVALRYGPQAVEDLAIDEWRDGAASGEIVEAFACGTAAVITPIAVLRNADTRIEMPAVADAETPSRRPG